MSSAQDTRRVCPSRGGRPINAPQGGSRIPLFDRIDELLQAKGRVFAAIDGHCAAGKSTLASELRTAYSCNVFRMDDFFLRPFQRTPERLAEPGGNIDYERFYDEVLVPLQSGGGFSYRPYDCQTRGFASPVSIAPTALNVVEGVYSIHPLFASIYDVKVFMDISPEEQRGRLSMRSPGMFDKFMRQWIPMELNYFEAFGIRGACDFVVTSNPTSQT